MSSSDAEDASGQGDTDGGESTSSDAADGQRPAPGAACTSDRDCSDDLLCNGTERCVKRDGLGTCAAGDDAPVCTFEHPCREETKGCDCRDDDADNDGYGAHECGGPDCDDSRNDCAPNGIETCDPGNHDEDCNAGTVSTHDIDPTSKDGDTDGDGYVDKRCKNFDPVARKWHTGDDCDDLNRYIRPLIPEVCNYVDDNCDGLVDEAVDPTTMEKKEGALRNAFYPDRDQDLYADMNATPRVECVQRIPFGYVFPTANDCDDDPRTGGKVHPNAVELCDGVDNDCDGAKDEASDVRIDLDFEDTTLQCIDGAVAITACPPDKLHCPGTPLERGCSTDATRLTSCRACNTDCRFSCGADGCDEIVQLAAGRDHTCARTRGGRVACWGRGGRGQLGNEGTGQSAVPAWVVGLPPGVSYIAAGFDHTCAIVGEDKILYCWGDNGHGQLGNPDAGAFSWQPLGVLGLRAAPRLTGVKQVAAGAQHTCAVLDSGALVCFGESEGGRLGNSVLTAGATLPKQAVYPEDPVLGVIETVGDAVSVAVGGNHNCIVTKKGTVGCWGSNAQGQAGQPSSISETAFVTEVAQLDSVSEVSAGVNHTCALRQGRVLCWGDDERQELGRGAVPDRSENWVPKSVDSLQDVIAVVAGGFVSCALQATATSCWGANTAGQLGPRADGYSSYQPVVQASEGAVSISVGGEHVCALFADQRVRCWGLNTVGQLGNGTISSSQPMPTPIRVPNP